MRIALFCALLVACGDDANTVRDGGDGGGGGSDGDSMIDADPNVRGTVTVKVVDKNATALQGFYVVFIDTDATVTERMTDAAGVASADVYPNASVTAIRNRGMSYAIATVQALNPGDVITLISASPNVSSSEDPFSQRVVPLPGADIEASPNGASKAGTTATYTTVAQHGLVTGNRVIVSGVGVAGYNGVWTVASTPSATTFTANIGSGGLANSGTLGGTGATAMEGVPFTVNYTAYATADHYEVHTRCATADVGTVTSVALTLPLGCSTTLQDIEVVARSSAGAALASTYQTGVTVTAGGSTTMPAAWVAPSTLTATYTNPTGLVSMLTLARFSPYTRGLPIAEMTTAVASPTVASLDVSKPPQAVNVTTLSCPMGTAPGCLSTANGGVAQRITERVDGTAGTYALDIDMNLLPWVKATYMAAITTLDVGVTGTAPFDIFEANVRYTRGQNIFTWRVFGPTAGPVKFPALPATAPGNPTLLSSDAPSLWQAFVGESDAVNGYRDAIKSPFDALGECEASGNPSVKPYTGTKNRISQWN